MDRYEISLWEDQPAIINGKSVLKEQKIAVIGSNTMVEQGVQARALEPNLVEEINGTHTFTFKMYYTYTDNMTGEKYENPFGKYLINERKIKVFWKNEWYDLVIKKCQEDTSGKSITYTCTDLFINELSKQGYSLEFDTELQNNIGTAEELATSVLEGSTWRYDSDKGTPIIQRTEGPMYEAIIETDFKATLQSPMGDLLNQNISKTGKILVFYDSVVDVLTGANQNIQKCQFLYTEDEGWTTDINDSLITNGKCYAVDGTWSFNENKLQIKLADLNSPFYIIPSQGVSDYRGKRLVKSQRTEYDPLLNRYVLLCEEGSGENKKEVYEVATTEYSNPLAVVNLIANPTSFTNVSGWVGQIDEFGIYPKFGQNTKIATYKATSYLKINSGETYNAGIQSNLAQFQPTDVEVKNGAIGGIQAGEKFVFRFKLKANKNNEPDNESGYIKSKVLAIKLCQYNKNEDKYVPTSESILTEEGEGKVNSDWFECILSCTTPISASEVKDYGFFIESAGIYWIEDIQFFKYMVGVTSYEEDAELKRMNPGEISLQSYASPVYKYYYKNNDAQKADELTYIYVGDKENTSIYKPVYNNYEKIGTISEKESNRFNILQTIAETFQAWVKFRIDHEEDGSIKLDEKGIPQKYVYFVEEIGEETGISFEYGIDLKTISRTIDSDKLATKVIVKNNTNEFAKNGFCSIARSNQNYSKENFILNLDYYTQQNLLDKETLNKDLYGTSENDIGYYYWLHYWNGTYDAITDELVTKNLDLVKQKAEQEVYQQYLQAAAQQKEIIESDLITLANVSAWPQAETYAQQHTSNEKIQSLLNAHGEIDNQINKYTQSLKDINQSIDKLEKYISDKQEEQNKLLDNIKEIHKRFNDKYSTYIMEGTWQDENYVDDDKYYLDGINVAYTSSRPQLSYSINVLRLSSLDEYSSKVFHLGDICYMQDREFFGYLPDKITPYKEKILVSKISSFFDEPEKDILTIQNYKTRFDDLFQRIAATTQSLQYAEGTFARAAGIINPDKTLSFAALQDTFDQNYDLILNSSNQDVTWDDTGITVTNKFNSADKTKIIAGGIFVTNDGGETWKNAVRGDGISTNLLTAGRVNTSEIYIYDGNAPSFRWDSDGLTAYSYSGDTINFGKFVRHDKYGIYGYDGVRDFIPSSEEDIWNKSKFGLTWNGFFLKSNNGNNSFEISTNNDLIIKSNGINRVQIGRLNGDNTNYGLQLRDENNNIVFSVDSNGASIAGWTMNNNSIFKNIGDNTIGLFSNGKYTTIQKHTDNYYIVAGNNFGVTSDGSIYANAGYIGGWKIEEGRLSSKQGNAYTYINSDGTLEGRTTGGSSWSIKRDGHFYFNDSNTVTDPSKITSQIVLGPTTINNTSVTTSQINASGGSIGGVGLGNRSGKGTYITNGGIYGKNWSLDDNGIICSAGKIGDCEITSGKLVIKEVQMSAVKGTNGDGIGGANVHGTDVVTAINLYFNYADVTGTDGNSVKVVTGLALNTTFPKKHITYLGLMSDA